MVLSLQSGRVVMGWYEPLVDEAVGGGARCAKLSGSERAVRARGEI